MTKYRSILLLLIILLLPHLAAIFLYGELELLAALQVILFHVSAIGIALLVATTISRFALRWLAIGAIATAVFFFEILELISFYLQGKSFNDQFFFHMTPETFEICWSVYPELLVVALVLYLGVQCAAADAARCISFQCNRGKRILLVIVLLLIMVLIDSAPKNFFQALSSSTVAGDEIESETLEQMSRAGLNTKALNASLAIARPGKNLVFLYLESLEKLYTEEGVFPGLTPNINRLMSQGLQFSDARQIPGASWSMGSMFTTQCGTPLLINGINNGNDLIQNGFLAKAQCLGDVLHQAGYNQTFMVGSSVEFAGMGSFYRSHHFQEALGLYQLQQQTPDLKYRHQWGLYDDTLFDLAAKKYFELADKRQPFNLMLITTDTHHPNGHLSHGCAPYPRSENTILNAVFCADQLVQRFIDRISQHPSYKDTVVVLYSDHLSMRNVAHPLFPKDYQRKLLFTVLNSEASLKNIQAMVTPVDVAPTLLSILNVKHKTEFLAGQDMLGKVPRREIAFENKSTIKLLRWANTMFFTEKNRRLCADEVLRYESNSIIKIGEQKVALTYQGHSSTIEKKIAAGELAIAAFFNNQREVTAALVLPVKKLADVINENSDAESLLIVSKKVFQASEAPEGWGGGRKIRVVYNHRDQGRKVVTSFDSLSDMKLQKKSFFVCSS